MSEKIDFYKWDKLTNLSFELVDSNTTEQYAVWDNKNRRVLREGVFPDGTSVEDSKFMKAVDWGTKFGTDYRKMYSVLYNVLINDTQYKISFSKGIHKQIQDKLDTLKSVGTNYSSLIWTVESNGKAGLDRRYTVRTEVKGSTLDAAKTEELQLTDAERKLVEGAKGFGNISEEQFMNFIKAQVPTTSEERAKEIFQAFF